jgi:CRP/FNR family cyclic AMP-dependent transcriptional regulator
MNESGNDLGALATAPAASGIFQTRAAESGEAVSFEQRAVQKFIAHSRKQSFRPRQLISGGSSGNDPGWVFLLLEGSASLSIQQGRGQAVLSYLHPGDFFGEGSLCEERPRPGITIRARGPAVVAMMRAEEFVGLAQKHPEFALELATQLAARLARAHWQVAGHALLDVTQRVTLALSDLCAEPEAKKGDDGVTLRINRLELAALVGCSREMIARVFKSLESDGHIAITGHSVLVRPSLTP